ncbi:hypothetical protein [Teredinibacter turnerae]|uniref:hypothetical protein n=1 Tax=Teredinibacter turnerae TaxID=2426 RepID=UPI0030CCF61B
MGNNRRSLFFLSLLALPTVGCAENIEPKSPKSATTTQPTPEQSNIRTSILDDQAVLFQSVTPKSLASIYFFGSVAPEKIAEWILVMLKNSGADASFLQKLEPRLRMNPKLKQASFELPILDMDGNTHQFSLERKHHNGVAVLSYIHP